MQFIPRGPDVPERLLQAHEDGRVVFFCGAGISYPARLRYRMPVLTAWSTPGSAMLIGRLRRQTYQQQVGGHCQVLSGYRPA
jgi:hypothetical protein